MATNFGLTTSSPPVNIVQSINYLLATQGTGNLLLANTIVYADITTGQVYTGNIGTISYINGYIDVKYANSATGGSGFASNSTNSNYYGVYNTNSAGPPSNNPADYQWTQVVGGFGNTKGLYYRTGGGGTISFQVGTTAPSVNYTAVLDNTPILLVSLANSIVVSNSIQPGAVSNVSIASNTIQGRNIQTNTITGNLIVFGTITGNLIAANTITGNLIQANTITGNLIQANTIQGNSIVAGSITATELQANLLIVGNIVSIGSTLDDPNAPGYWLNNTTGNVRFGGNASIGQNLYVSGLVTAGNLNTDTVSTTNIVSQAVSLGNAATSTSTITVSNPTINTPYFYTFANVSANLTSTAGISNYVSGVLATDQTFNYTGGGSTQTWILTFYLYRGSTALVAQTFRYDVDSTNQSRFNNIVPFAYLDSGLSANVNYVYSMAVATNTTFPTLLLKSGTLISQILKR